MQRVDGFLRKESFLDLLLNLFKIKPTQEQREIPSLLLLTWETEEGTWRKTDDIRSTHYFWFHCFGTCSLRFFYDWSTFYVL